MQTSHPTRWGGALLGSAALAATLSTPGCSDYTLSGKPPDHDDGVEDTDGNTDTGLDTTGIPGGEQCVTMERAYYFNFGQTKNWIGGYPAQCSLWTRALPAAFGYVDAIEIRGRSNVLPGTIRYAEGDWEAVSGGDNYPEADDQHTLDLTPIATDGNGGWAAVAYDPQFGTPPNRAQSCRDTNVCLAGHAVDALWLLAVEVRLGADTLFDYGIGNQSCAENFREHLTADGGDDGYVQVCYQYFATTSTSSGRRSRNGGGPEGGDEAARPVAPTSEPESPTPAVAGGRSLDTPPPRGDGCVPGDGEFALLPGSARDLRRAATQGVPLVPVRVAGVGELTASARIRDVSLVDGPGNALVVGSFGPAGLGSEADSWEIREEVVVGAATFAGGLPGDAWFSVPGGVGWYQPFPRVRMTWTCGAAASDGDLAGAFVLVAAELGCWHDLPQRFALRPRQDPHLGDVLELSLLGRPAPVERIPVAPDGTVHVVSGGFSLAGARLAMSDDTLMLRVDEVSYRGVPLCGPGVVSLRSAGPSGVNRSSPPLDGSAPSTPPGQ